MVPRKTVMGLGVLVLGGCAPLAHMDQLLTLQAYSKEKDAQHRIVEEQERRFEALRRAAAEGDLRSFPDREAFREAFGDPILIRRGERGGRRVETWLYRPPVTYFGVEKIYLHFDPGDGRLLDWERVPPVSDDGEDRAEGRGDGTIGTQTAAEEARPATGSAGE